MGGTNTHLAVIAFSSVVSSSFLMIFFWRINKRTSLPNEVERH